MTQRLRIERDGALAHVILSRPDKHNGLDLPMLSELAAAPRRLGRDRGVRAVVLRGDGPSFSTGLDFAAVGRQPARMATGVLRPPWRRTNWFQEACWAWRRLGVPVIAALHGRCYGGALQLALAADFRIAAPDCELSVMEARWGLVPDMSGTITLRELLGIDVAKRLAMTGEAVTGARAAELGLVTEAADDPVAAAGDLAGRLAARSPDAVAATKGLFQRAWPASPARALRLETRYQLRLLLGRNHRAARAAGRAGTPEFAPRSVGR